MKSMSIELNKEVAQSLLSWGEVFAMLMPSGSNVIKLPSQKVELQFFNYLSSMEQIKKDLAPLFASATLSQKAIAEKIFKDYLEADFKATFSQISDSEIEVKVVTLFTHQLFVDKDIICFTYKNGGIVLNKWQNMSNNEAQGIFTAKKILGLLSATLNYLDKPTTVKTTSVIKTPRSLKKRSKGKKQSVKYVYKTVYKIKKIANDTPHVKREVEEIVNNKKEREYLKEEWKRKGHYRVYRNKETGEIVKEVWIKPTICRAKGKIKEEQKYKITKLN